MKEMSESLRALYAEADAAFARKEWARAGGLWSRVAAEFDSREYRIGDVALNASVSKRLACLPEYVDDLRRYHEDRSRRTTGCGPRMAIFTSIVGAYDSVKMPHIPDARFDYILFSEVPISGGGLWEVHPITASNCNSARATRYVKMHPHTLLSGYDIAIWIDSNVMLLGDLYPLVEKFLAAPEPVGAIQHPYRENIYQEVWECIRQRKDASAPMLEQTAVYREQGFVHHDLVEANVLMFKLGDVRLHTFLARWWSELERGSRRDQLAFNYALRQAGIDWHRLLERPSSARTHPAFAYVEHDYGIGVAQVLIDALGEARRDPYTDIPGAPFAQARLAEFAPVRAEVIVFLGSATPAASNWFEALMESRKAIQFALKIVVDATAREGADPFLKRLMKQPWISIEAAQAGGPTAARNAALAVSKADVIVLLEAGITVAAGWMDKMVDALLSTPGAGIVAPLAHSGGLLAAAARKGASSLRAVDEACEQESVFGLTPRVPAAGGLCLGVRRNVIARIGLLDHESFPREAGWDVDFCFRAADAGFDTVIATQTCVAAGARHSGVSGTLPTIRSASEALARAHGGRRVSRAFMTLQNQPIIERLRDRMRARTDAWIDIAMPSVLSLRRLGRHL